MPSSSPPKAAGGAAGLLDSTMPSNPGATMGSTKVIRLPQLQPSAEYSTLRLAKLQPSAKLKTWDSRRATGSALSAVPMLPAPVAAPMSARVERSQVPTISQLSTQYLQSSRSPQTSRSLSRSVRLFDSEIFNLDHEELSSYCLRGREASQPGAQLPSSGPQSGTAALQDEEADQRQVETVPAHLVQIRAMYSPTKTQPSEVEGAEDGGDSPALGASATSPTGAELGVLTTTAEEMLQAQVPDEEWDEETMLRRELAKLRTGEDVIAFFAKNGSNSSVKFVYCKRRENVDVTEFRPYDLEVISELMDGSSSATTASKLGEHFTISATGVVHVSPGQQSEHMSLGDWMHQCLMYSVLTSMNFFKYYIHGKVFSRWQQHTRFTLYCHARKNLVRRLFLAKPLFVGPLIKICSLMREVESVKVVNIGSNVYNLADFDREQATVRSASCAQKELEMLHDQTVAAMDKLVQVVGQATEPQSHEPPQGTLRPRMKSMVQEKKEASDSARRHRLAVYDNQMLGDCVRLVDYMFQACLVKVVINASVEFFNRVDSSTKMFSISVAYGEKTMVFDPSLDQFLEMLTKLWRSSVQVVNGILSLLSSPHYVKHLSSSTGSTQTVESILHHNRQFNHYTAAVREKIFTDITNAQKFSDKHFELFRRIHDYGNNWDEEAYLSSTTSHEELASDMGRMREFQADLDKYKPHHNVGIIVVDGRTLRASLQPVPERGLAAMKKALTDIARRKCQGVLQRFDHANKILDERPKSLTAYADYVKAFNDIKNQEAQMEEMREEVESMYQLLRQYNVRVSGDDTVQMEFLQTKGSDFADRKLIEGNAYIREKTDEMVESLNGVSQLAEEEAKKLTEQLRSGSFVSQDNIHSPEVVLEELTTIQVAVTKLEEKAANYNEYQALFYVPVQFEFQEVEKAKQLFTEKSRLWNLISDWKGQLDVWKKTDITQLNVEEMNKKVLEYSKTAYQLTRSLEGDKVAQEIRSEVDEWKGNMPCILDLGNPALRDRHRLRIRQEIDLKQTAVSLTTLIGAKVFDKKDHKEFIAEISGIASGEFALEQQLEKVIAAWEDMPLPVQNHRNQRDLWILGDVGDIITQLEDHSVQIQTMMGSRFVRGIRDRVETWETKIRLASDTIDEWLQVQRGWMYLESIFSAEDIQKQLPTESAKFKGVDKFWKDTLKKVRQSYRKAMEAFHIPNLLAGLRNASDQLDQIQKSLEAYLETKRASFPRFYFLSDDELLSIMSQTRNPEAVQEHLGKCFDAISKVTFTEDKKKDIVDMSDMIKEKVHFVSPVQTTGSPVERWLGQIEMRMVESLQALTKAAVEAYPEDGIVRKDWLFGPFPAQAALAVDQIMWTKCAEDALNLVEKGNHEAMRANINFTNKQLEHSVELVRLDLTKLQRVLMGALIVLDVHGISVLEQIDAAKCRSVNDFDWSKQLRYYWAMEEVLMSDGTRTSDTCIVKQTIANIRYSFEYLGNTPRLVVTPLTDKCYMTLTGAIHLNYGGAPAGPAGTGKTETTKDLGKALAVPVIVFNCSDGLDYKIMGRFFSGLAQAGAWACFDEFNRIQVEVLSVIAQQMLTVTHAIRARKETFEFVGREIPLNPRFGVFITMNPGYAGRAELPDNLKSLFRPVAMMVPDYCLIAEIILYSEGFGSATALARKMVNLYSLSSEQLSKQDHYDFGMRAVKSVLVMAGQLKRKYPTLVEDVTLIRALRDSNVPKFLSFDLPLFFGIISDLYPEVDVPYVDYGSLQKEIENQLRLSKLQVVPSFVGKIIQLLETQLVRHGVMVVGNTFIGKSTNIQVLSKALSKLRQDNSPDPAHQLTKTFSLNPKSITMEELYGFSNINTGEWTDGLVALLVREAVSDTSDSKKWVVFDGPVDAIWIENMNTVLDDNKMLCLANGERIKLPPTMTMLFEVADLKVASPATVSRCGMVYLEPVHLGWKPLVQSWAENFKKKYPSHSDTLKKWVIDLCDKALPFLREECKEAPGIPSVDTNLVASFLKMLTTFISPQHGFKLEEGREGKATQAENKHEKVLARIYCAFSAVWSLGANLHEASRKKFQDFLRAPLQMFCPEVGDEDLYTLCVNDAEASFIPISALVPTFSFDATVPFFNILVPTVETTLQRILVENLMGSGYHVLFSGETGVGKSVGIQQFLGSAGESFAVASANFSAQTSSANVVDFLENTLERKRKTLLGAPAGKTMLLFIDDINMPMLEKYGAQPPIELLRQVIDYKGFYDRKKLFWKGVQETQLIAACGPPGGGRMEVTPRLLRHFNMIWMTALPQETMHRILSSILGGWLGVKKPALQELASDIVAASVEMFFRIISDLLPTPLKCHYTFNLRDPAKMLQGMLMVNVRTELSDDDSLIRLWVHETCRQFRDRLVNKEDRTWFNDCLHDNLEKHLQRTWPIESFADLMFGDFFDRNEKPYVQATDPVRTQLTFEEALEEYNGMNASKMNLVFFKDAQEHLARAARIIRQPRGNALLVGVSGVGRKSLARMAAHMAEFACSSIEITRTYGVNDFREDLKRMMMDVLKSEGKGLAFLFSDTQIVKESFLEDINNILNTGEVPNLFQADEQEQVIGLTRPLAKAAGKVDARDVLWQHFVQVVREGFHIILAFSPVGEGFRARCRQFPSLINCATVDWYDPWPEDALVSVAERYYLQAPKELELDASIAALSKISCVIHASASEAAERFFDELRRKTYMTPTSYLELIKLFTDLLGMKKGELDTKLNRYRVGAQRLKETETVVDKLKVDLTKMQPVIEQGKKDTEKLIVQVDKEEAVAKEAQAACEIDEKEAGEAAATANAIKTECQRELDEALPEYYDAIKALDSLDKKDIQEVKSFAKPPALVEVVLSAVCLLMNKKETWDEAKKVMNDTGFLQSLKDYDKDALAGNVKLTQKLQKYVKREDFQPDQVRKVSNAATSLCMWVRAMDVYARVARSIEPKKEKLKGAEDAFATAEAKLQAKKKELQVVQDNVAALQQQLAKARSKAEKLEQDAETCKVQLTRAEKLLSGLGNESVRWDAASQVLEKNIKFVMGDIALAAGFIAYAGPFTASFRGTLIAHWLEKAKEVNLTADPAWKCSDTLCEPAEIREWNIKSLPADDLSVENGILVTRGRRWPLMIDPQGQGNRWIRNMKKDSGLGIIKLSTPNFLRTVETCIREGNAILLENVEEVLDPSLEPVLLKQVFKKGGQLLLRLGSEDVPYNESFQFFVTTKMANPHYLPEICIKVTVINFTVTLLGLEDQLVAEVVKNERPDLSELRAGLVVQIAADKAEMDRLEQLILKLLSEAGDDLLSDDTLIVTLDQSKKTGDGCKERMVSAELSMKEIDEVTEVLRPCATRASIIYFVVADLANIDPMYQYSLQFFTSLFQQRLAASPTAEDISERIHIIIQDFTQFIYTKICMGLFEDHKLLYSFMICNRCLRHEVHAQFMHKQRITLQEWSFFLRGLEAGKGIIDDTLTQAVEPPAWMTAQSYRKMLVLEQLTLKAGSEVFQGLAKDMFTPAWENFGTDDHMAGRSLPGMWAEKLTPFQQLLVIKSLRENFLQLVVRNFVGAELGKHYTVSPDFDLVGCFKDSKKTMPLIFVLSAGADPTDYLVKLAKDFEYEERLHFISLGQGQGQKAEALIKHGQETGDWVCLQNCHLAASWMPTLERIQEMQDPDSIDDMYRLWLTSMPSPTFPVPVLQGGIKITNEPPKGLRANLTRTFQDITPEIYEGCTKPREFKKLLYALAFFHAAILERRKFGPIGWNVPYEWMDSDFQVSREQVQMYLESQPGVPWITLNYIIAEVNYGGRVTDDKDVRLISAFLKRYFNEGVLQDGYKLSPLDAYTCPKEGSLDEVREHVRSLPFDEDPQVFGLHPNAQITAQTEEARKFLGIILSVQPRIAAAGGGKRPEELVAEMAEAFLGRVPSTMLRKHAHPETYKKTADGGIVSLGVFHGQEMDRFNVLINRVQSTLVTLGKAIKGFVVMSAQLEDMYNCFLSQQLPPLWGEVSYPCLKPLNAWFSDFEERIEFMARWLKMGPPSSYWVPCFYFPQGFMTCSKQVHARKTKIPIDALVFWQEMTTCTEPRLADPPADGVNVHGLFLQGAGWDVPSKKMVESEKAVLFKELPVIWVQVVEEATFQKVSTEPGRYTCPLYKTSLRKGTLATTGHSTNFVCYFRLPSNEEDQGHWVRRGVALLCMLDD